ncbi:type VI secretion system-associated protein TagO [Bisgaard Taxon 10/6]|uniref:Type VI secretion system-associated protein TagO n=1 Tax=Exercitatus varius TaxID=67857 RepID=A0ABT6ETG6_9PAST|nr:type VI secretion system-associated protein TagO [Exercitatus varius]MDG2940395.1 type VI secretion system-associated protein TagO [Exercitatus varius]MDG2942769.1 type VI secretion system-associated protein TagO [Exercitatus varius]MDG2946841.1 type VI secretion system-associated protein TagO [Exercitatus varius]MDG2953079.1 type VI secretion system-associated protein TagO [Exercitatus varius]
MHNKTCDLNKNIIILSILAMVTTFAQADTNNNELKNNPQVQQCTAIKSNARRLLCFDELFETPIRTQDINAKSIDSVIPKTVSDIFALANSDNAEEIDSNELQIGLPSEEKEQAAIYIACKDNITRFQIVLKDPVSKNPLNVEIADSTTNKTASKVDWQNAERGYMLDAGRGLYAIQQLKTMLYIDSFNIIIPQEKRKYTFKNNGLASRVAAIRKECGW